MPQTFGERLRELRIARGFSQSDLAEAVLGKAVRNGEISKWEAGKNEPSHAYLVRLAQVLRVSVDTLLGVVSITEATLEKSIPVSA
jgi:transcriptional regulator with XRE-family HTH domain